MAVMRARAMPSLRSSQMMISSPRRTCSMSFVNCSWAWGMVNLMVMGFCITLWRFLERFVQ